MPATSSAPGSQPQAVANQPRRRRPPAPDPISAATQAAATAAAVGVSSGAAGLSAPPSASAVSSPTPRTVSATSPPASTTSALTRFLAGEPVSGGASLDRFLGATSKGVGSGLERGEQQIQRQARRQLKTSLAKTYPGLDPSQSNILSTILTTGLKADATRKELLAATETGLVESNLANLGYGDADSEGWRQERTSIYGPTAPTNVKGAARRFFEESISDTGGSRGQGMTAGELAQAIQGSAFPERYDQAKAVAAPLLNEFLDRVERSGVDVGDLPSTPRQPRGLSVDELFYDPGTSLVDNQPSAPIGGHSDHVHFGSERQADVLRVAKIAERLGLDIRENPLFDPVDPVHVGGSMHYDEEELKRGLRDEARALGATGNTIGSALDISGDPAAMARLDQRVAQLAGAPLAPAGSSVVGGGPALTGGVAAPGGALAAALGQGSAEQLHKDRPNFVSAPIQNPLSARAALPVGFPGAGEQGEALTALQALLAGDGGTGDSELASILAALIPQRRT